MVKQPTLASALAETRAAVHAILPPPVASAFDRSGRDLAATGQAGRAVGAGELIALPILAGPDGRPLDLLKLADDRPVVLLFVRGGWCPYCAATLRAYARALPAIEAANGLLVAVTPERPERAAEVAEAAGPGVVLACDGGNRFAQSLGLAFALPDVLRPAYRRVGVDIEGRNGDRSRLLPIPATYVLAPCGRVTFAHVAADHTRRAEPADVVAALRRINADGAAPARAA